MYTNLRKQIIAARKLRDISQEEMAERLSIDKRTYQRIEYGEKKFFDIVMLFRIAKILEIDIFPIMKDIFKRS